MPYMGRILQQQQQQQQPLVHDNLGELVLICQKSVIHVMINLFTF